MYVLKLYIYVQMYVYCSYNESQKFELWIFYSNLKIDISIMKTIILIFKNTLEFETCIFKSKN